MTYFDTSYLLKCYLSEAGSHAVKQLAVAQPQIVCCALGRVELIAAFHRKLRERRIDPQALRHLLDQLLADDADGLWTWLELSPDVLLRAADAFKTMPPDVYLRSADAIHLACAAAAGFSAIYSSDRHLLAAATHFGIAGHNVIT